MQFGLVLEEFLDLHSVNQIQPRLAVKPIKMSCARERGIPIVSFKRPRMRASEEEASMHDDGRCVSSNQKKTRLAVHE
jgi:hypothetical protein